MNKLQKIQFVQEKAGDVISEIVDLITNDRIPERWESPELRQYLSDRFQRAGNSAVMIGSRLSSYAFDCTVNDL